AAAAAPDMGGGGGSRPRRGSPRRDTLENRGTAARGGRQHGRGGIPATGTRGSARGPAGAGAAARGRRAPRPGDADCRIPGRQPSNRQAGDDDSPAPLSNGGGSATAEGRRRSRADTATLAVARAARALSEAGQGPR